MKAGIALLSLLVTLGVAAPWLVPFPEADRHWHDLTYWQDSPAAAPPVWTGGSSSRALTAGEPLTEPLEGGGTRLTWAFLLPGGGPTDLVVVIAGAAPVPVTIAVPTADKPRELLRCLAHPTAAQPERLKVTAGGRSLLVSEFFPAGTSVSVAPLLLMPGKASGWLGTDASKRDVFSGVLLSLRWALVLGLLVSFLTVLLGLVLGVTAACWGGWIDALLSRVYEFFSLLPLLPLLIVLSAMYQPSLWSFFVLAVLFFWTKAFKPVYAMALQVRQEDFVEASRSMGSGRFWRAFRHVVPALLPYAFAVMALAVPAVVLYEASISLLGLGDTTTVTWGQMLHDALVQGAVAGGLWWWVLPPGLMIGVTGVAFALLGRKLR